MATLNRCAFIGHLGRDPVMNATPDGLAVTKFSLAVDEYAGKKSAGGDKRDKTTLWLDIVCFGHLAEMISSLVKKGMQVYVQGRLTKRPFTDRNGIERVAIEIIAHDVQVLDPKPAAARAASTGSKTTDPLGDFDEPF